MSLELKGILPILSTPFHEDGRIDEASLIRLIRYCLENGAHGLAGLGDVSECHKLTEAERKRITDLMVREAAGCVPVIVGVSAASVAATVLFSRYAEDAGADVLLVKPTPVGAMNEAAVRALFEAVAEATTLPLMAHDMETPAPLSTALLRQLADDLPQLRYVKEEWSPCGWKIAEIRAALGDRLALITGQGGRSILDDFQRGAVGNMPGCHVLKPLVKIYHHLQAGEWDAARAEHNRIAPLILFRQLPAWGVTVTKEIFHHYGLFTTPTLRPPTGLLLDDRDRRELRAILESVGGVM
jgi:4-hydroxy-tetrahydrodipicolinate synthase